MSSDRDEWVKNLKVGDEVHVAGSRANLGHIAKVTSRTPSGRIVVGHMTFNPDGWQRGGSVWHRVFIEPVTDQVREGFERQSLVGQLHSLKWNELDTATLREVAARAAAGGAGAKANG